MLNQPSLVILIDFWHPVLPFRTTRPGPFRVDDTIDFLSTDSNIKTVVLSTYNSRSELFFQPNSLWYHNRKEWYKKSSTWAKDRATAEDKNIIKDNTINNARTDWRILQYYNPNQYQIAMFQYWEIEYYLSIHTEIKNIYVLGCALEVCLKTRPIGYLALSKLQNVSILTHTDLVRTDNGEKPDLSLDPEWTLVENKVYRYVGNIKVDT